VIPPESVTARLVITCRYGFGPVARAAPPAGVADAPAGVAADGLPVGTAAPGPPLVRGAGAARRPVLGVQDAAATTAAVSQTMLRTMCSGSGIGFRPSRC
jgi:hypothetical protein